MNETRKSARTAAVSDKAAKVWTEEERDAMVQRAKELKAEARRSRRADKAADKAAEEEREVLAKIAEMPEADRVMAERIHAIVTASAPELAPKTYYGMPAYAREGKTVCFFKPASKFSERYSTFGFEQTATLDDGSMWPTSWALTKLTAADEDRIAALVKKAVS
jgi:uncharacterized protein YdhG (YjbR/CyaY superfamily)